MGIPLSHLLDLLSSSSRLTKTRPPISGLCRKQTADMNQHATWPLSPPANNTTHHAFAACLNSRRTRNQAASPRRQLTEDPESQPAEHTGRPAPAGDRPGSDRRGYEGHSKPDLCPDRGTRLAVLWGGVVWRRHILACRTCGDPRLVLMRFSRAGFHRRRTTTSATVGSISSYNDESALKTRPHDQSIGRYPVDNSSMTGCSAAETQGKAGVRTSREGEVQLLNPNGGMGDAGEQEAKFGYLLWELRDRGRVGLQFRLVSRGRNGIIMQPLRPFSVASCAALPGRHDRG